MKQYRAPYQIDSFSNQSPLHFLVLTATVSGLMSFRERGLTPLFGICGHLKPMFSSSEASAKSQIVFNS